MIDVGDDNRPVNTYMKDKLKPESGRLPRNADVIQALVGFDGVALKMEPS